MILLHVWIFPIEEKLSELQIPAAFFIHFHIFFHHRGKLHLIQLLWKAQICSILSSKFIFPSPIEWETELTKWKIWLYFYSVNILVSVTNMWGWWKEKCLSRLKPRSIWTLRLHTSFCGSVERAKIIFSEPKLRLSNWLESPRVLRPSDQSPPMSISLRLEYSSRPCLTNHDL